MRKKIQKDFNLHGLVRIRVETIFPEKMQNVLHHLAEFESREDEPVIPDILIRDYQDFRPVPPSPNQLAIPDFCTCSGSVLDIPPYSLSFDLAHSPIILFSEKGLYLPLNFLIHTYLLRKGFAMIHAASFQFQENIYLFPSFGGIGKTSLVAAAVFAGAKLFGDDMLIIDHHNVYSYPQAFSVYPYHLPILQYKDNKLAHSFRKTKYLNFITDRLESFSNRPAKLFRVSLNSLKVPCANIPPRKIFGDHCFAEHGPVDCIYFLRRINSDNGDISITDADPIDLAKTCTSILFHEWHNSLRYLLACSHPCPFVLPSM